MNNSPIPVACLVLLDRKDCVLVTLRPMKKTLAGLWEFPGGKVECDESPEAALRRELDEELQLQVGELFPITPVVHTYIFGEIQLYPFISRCEDRPSVHLLEHTDYRWVNLEELRDIDLAPADIPIIEQIVKFLDGR